MVMLATLPGRTQGLGLITEPLLADFGFDRVQFAQMNLWATLAGALFCFPAGWLLDRFGLRGTTAGLIALLAAVVSALALSTGGPLLFLILLTLTRGLGQSALSIASITSVGKRFGSEVGQPMALFSVCLSLLFALAFGWIGYSVRTMGWRAAWLQVAAFLAFAIAPLVLFSLRVKPVSRRDSTAPQPLAGLTLREALRTRAFWTFAASAALFNLVSSGLGLFNESVLAERGFGQKMFHLFLAITTLLSLGGQFLCGWLSSRVSYQRLTAFALGLYALALLMLPSIKTPVELFCVCLLIGVAGGMIIVIFFAIWSVAFGRKHLAQIQGAAQCLTVISSALGPVLFAKVFAVAHSYSPLLLTIALIVIAIALLSLTTPFPKSSQMDLEPCPAS